MRRFVFGATALLLALATTNGCVTITGTPDPAVEEAVPEGTPEAPETSEMVRRGGPGGTCDVGGVLRYNGNPVSNEPIKCYSTGQTGSVPDTTGSAGEISCQVLEGNLWFEARGKTSGYCENGSGQVIYCNSAANCYPNVSGCAQYNVQWQPSLVIPWLAVRRRLAGSRRRKEER